ncbi:chromate transporter [Cohnella sp. AR92]|uniref:chromate transporter n=1 Tax=Cohnella sp. AR92 TaxID=648716 RepID=UPI0026936008|nr:chromate transporter [Cohnella sp. AR92]
MGMKINGDYGQLFWAMFKTGVLGFGGGPSVIPLIRHEAVKNYNWIDNDEFGEILALANALPGPIATKMAAYLGYRKKGTLGATVAVLSHVLPSALAMIALMSVVQTLSSSQIVQGMIAGVIPVVAVMLGVMAYEFGEKTVKGLGAKLGIGLFAVAFVLLQLLSVHDAIVIALFLAYGAVHFKLLRKLRERKQPKEANGG